MLKGYDTSSYYANTNVEFHFLHQKNTEFTKSFLRVEEGKIHSPYSLVKREELTQDSDQDDMDVIYY